jgi:hypothetical protein
MCCGQKRTELLNNQPLRAIDNPRQFMVANSVVGNSGARVVQTQPLAAPAKQAGFLANSARLQTGSIQRKTVATSPIPRHAISVRYLENAPIRVRGLVSGVYYEFSRADPVQQVDSRDSSGLLSTRFFRRV